MRLKELQHDFLQAFLEQKEERHEQTRPSFLKNIQKGQKLSEQERLAIYQESITECLANALRETYPVCEKLVGEDFFTGMAYRYIEKTPSTSPNLFHYGYRFADFVADFKPASALPWLSDVCHLEWAWHQACYAPDQQTMDFNALANISDELQHEVIFKLPSGSTLLKSDYPIHRIWKANQAVNHNESVINLGESGAHLLIWQKNPGVTIDDLNEDEWQILKSIDQKLKLADICKHTQSTIDIITLLAKCVECGWIADFEVTT